MADGASIASGVKRSVQNPAPFGDCKRCDKAGFPILPMRFAYTPRSAASEVGSASLTNQDYSFRAGVLGMRLLSQGFLYVLDERGGGTWRAFQASIEGSLSEFPVARKPEPVEPQCGRFDHAVRSATFSVPDPKSAKRIWVAYFSVWQTEHQLQMFEAALLGKAMPARLEDDPDVELKDLKARFQEFSVPDLVAGAKAGEVQHQQADAFGLSLARVKDYAPEFGGRHALYAESVTPGVDRSGLATSVAQRMADMHEAGGVALYLHDPIGIAMEIRHLSSLKRLQIEEINQKYRRQIAVKQLIEQIGKSWKAHGTEKEREWLEEYINKIDATKLGAFEREFAADMGQRPMILNGFCDDIGEFQKSWALRHACKHDFDIADADSTIQMVCQMATIMGGGPHGEIDRQHALHEFERPVEENLWYWAITAGQKSLLRSIAEDKQADAQGIVKSAYSVLDAWNVEKGNYISQLQAHLAGTGAPPEAISSGAVRRTIFRACLGIEEALRNLMTFGQGLLSDINLAAFKHVRVFAMAGALWFRTAVQPLVEEVAHADFIRDNKQSAWGHSLESRLQHTVDAEGAKRSAINVADVTDELGEAGRKKIPLLRIHWGEMIEIDSLSGEQARRVGQELNRRQRRAAAKPGKGSGAGRAPGKSAKAPLSAAMEKVYEQLHRQALIEQVSTKVRQEVAADAARINRTRVQAVSGPLAASPALAGVPRATTGGWSSRTMAALKQGGASGTLAVWAMAFQGVAIAASFKEALDKPSGTALAKITASILGFLGAGFEATGAAMTLRSYFSKRAATIFSLSGEAVAAAGGVIGGFAGIIMGALTMMEGRVLTKEGDEDAGGLMVVAGVLLTVSGFATGLGGLSILGAIGGGPVVWTIVAVGAAILGLYVLVSAEEKRDNAVQVWLRSCIFGKMPKYLNEEEERRALEALYVVPFAVTAIWRSGRSMAGFSFGGTVDIIIDAPDVRAGKGWLEHSISLEMKDGRKLAARSARLVESSIRTGLTDPNRLSEGLEHHNRGLSAPTSGGANLRVSPSGGVMWRLCYVTDALRSVEVVARFWPDKVDNAGLVLPNGNGISHMLTAGN